MRMMQLDTDNKWLVFLNESAKLKILRGYHNLVKPRRSEKQAQLDKIWKLLEVRSWQKGHCVTPKAIDGK